MKGLAESATTARTEQPVSCTTCRARKTKCVKPRESDTCLGCKELQIPCIPSQASGPRKPYGRPYETTPIPAGAMRISPSTTDRPWAHNGAGRPGNVSSMGLGSVPPHPSSIEAGPSRSPSRVDDDAHTIEGHRRTGESERPPGDFLDRLFGSSDWLPDFYPVNIPLDLADQRTSMTTTSDPPFDVPEQADPSNHWLDHHALSSSEPVSGPHATSLGYTDSIDDVLSWSTLLTFVGLYRERIYPRLPIIHWPTFSQNLVSRKDKTDESFRSFLLILLAYTILQLPPSAIPDQCRSLDLDALHTRCSTAARRLRPNLYYNPELDHVCCDYIYLRSLEQSAAADVILAQAMRLAILLGCHESTDGMQGEWDFVERETKKRVFWLIYGSDRTTAALTGRPLLLSDDEITASEPLEVDDELLTNAGSFPQPSERVPIIAGFVRVTRVFRILSRTIQLLRRAKTTVAPTSGGPVEPRSLALHLDPMWCSSYVLTTLGQLDTELVGLPLPLRVMNIDQNAPQPPQHAFETCKANILVTQALARYELYQLASSTGNDDYILDNLTQSVLGRLDMTSGDYLTANGSSMRHKVVSIAAFLLGRESGTDPEVICREALSILNKTVRNTVSSPADSTAQPQT
ncbi:hypothetical protein IAT40_002175 [Kwoniella sp. CBS 6097]